MTSPSVNFIPDWILWPIHFRVPGGWFQWGNVRILNFLTFWGMDVHQSRKQGRTTWYNMCICNHLHVQCMKSLQWCCETHWSGSNWLCISSFILSFFVQNMEKTLYWLVVYLPLWKIWIKWDYYGLLFPIYGETKKMFELLKPPTRNWTAPTI
jgi:hypothetical protein